MGCWRTSESTLAATRNSNALGCTYEVVVAAAVAVAVAVATADNADYFGSVLALVQS